MPAKIEAICTSSEKGVVKTPVDKAELKVNHGLVGDAHAGDWHRQVSLLATESIAKIKAILPDLPDGAFAENVVTSGVELKTLPIGAKLHLGKTVLEVTQIGKECHQGCAIREATGDCVMPREGIFCKVLQGGTIQPGDSVVAESGLAAL
ncbi:MAG: MOSC domain-containing protein [bacterium]|nr:MOSC domain-containing protein [bacterium]